MQIRRLDSKDMPWVEMQSDQMAATLYPELISDWDKRRSLLAHARTNPIWYARVVGPVGKPEAVLIARTGDNLWASRKHSAIMLWFSQGGGHGVKLLRDYRDWVQSQKGIVFAGWVDDYGISNTTRNSFSRNGFVQRGGMYVFVPQRI